MDGVLSKMKMLVLLSLVPVIILGIGVVYGQTGSTGEEEVESPIISRIFICLSIKEREPQGIGKVFSRDVGQLFCFTDVRDTGDESFITHNWYYKDTLTASVRLKVAGATWRTWSSKRIGTNMEGQWRVEILNSAGRKIAEIPFIVGDTDTVDDRADE